MTGENNLQKVLDSLVISCDSIKYGFATTKDASVDISDNILGTFQEKEGLTIIANEEYFKQKDIPHEGPYAKLTIEVHTSLELVGLTAVLAAKLAEKEISANVVAAFFHDHIFVQYDLREKATNALNQLKKT